MSGPQVVRPIPDDMPNLWQCMDCGGLGRDGRDTVKHYPTCKPGDAKKWEEYYSGCGTCNCNPCQCDAQYEKGMDDRMFDEE